MRRSDSRYVREGFSREWWKAADDDTRAAFLDTLTEEELDEFAHDWAFWARDKQLLPEGVWHTALLLCGRGFGKSRTGSEWISGNAKAQPGSRWCLLGPGEGDVRSVMIEGDSGLLAIAPKTFRPKFYPSLTGGELHWPNGSVGYVFSSEDPESLRGPQFHGGWCDEPMAMNPKKREAAISNMMFGMRLGTNPQTLFTTTPKPHRWLVELMGKIERDKMEATRDQRPPKYVFIKGSTFENDDLPAAALQRFKDDYEGTNLGRQELEAELIGDEEGALWTPKALDAIRMPADTDPVEFAASCEKVVVAVDPNVSSGKTAHAAGIIVVGKRADRRYVIADRSTGGGPLKWAKAAVDAWIEFDADEVIGEVNNGGDLVRLQILQAAQDAGVDISVHKVRASKGKQRRAEPVATTYERKLIWHIGGCGSKDRPGPLYKLEVQMCALHENVDPTGEDFDRADALVWGMTRLGLKRSSTRGAGHATVGIATFEEMSSGGDSGAGYH